MKTLRESLLDDFGSQAKDLRKEQIKEWLEKNNRHRSNFKINDDYTINIYTFDYKGDGDFPDFIQFNRCEVDFICNDRNMTSLRGCPSEVGGNFNCRHNRLKTLDGGPKRVDEDYECSNNELTSLRGCPSEVGGNFNCCHNRLKTLDDGPKRVDGGYVCHDNELISLKGCAENIWDYFDCRNNQLEDLVGGPKTVKGNYFCEYNKDLISLDGGPNIVKGDIYLKDTGIQKEEIEHFLKTDEDFKR